MNFMIDVVLIIVGIGVAFWLLSHLLELLRRAPDTSATLSWAPDIPVQYAEIDGHKLRYVMAGQGPDLVLLHTLRTQLDLFQKVVPALTERFTVYAFDYPGHGFSDIPHARYDADFFVDTVERALDHLDLKEVTLAGVSIGGSIALIIAGRGNPRVSRVVAINPYDYAKGRGMARSSPIARMITLASGIPIIGETVMRLRNAKIMKDVFEGGVADPSSIPSALLKEMYVVGNRPGHYRAFLRLLRHAASWEAATSIYAKIAVPVLLMWGDQDWANPAERSHDHQLIPGAKMITIDRGGHFLPLDQPEVVTSHIVGFALESNQ